MGEKYSLSSWVLLFDGIVGRTEHGQRRIRERQQHRLECVARRQIRRTRRRRRRIGRCHRVSVRDQINKTQHGFDGRCGWRCGCIGDAKAQSEDGAGRGCGGLRQCSMNDDMEDSDDRCMNKRYVSTREHARKLIQRTWHK